MAAPRCICFTKVADGVDSVVMGMTPYAEIEYGGISSTLTGELTINDVRILVKGYRDDIVIGRLDINTPSFLTF